MSLRLCAVVGTCNDRWRGAPHHDWLLSPDILCPLASGCHCCAVLASKLLILSFAPGEEYAGRAFALAPFVLSLSVTVSAPGSLICSVGLLLDC